MAESLPPEIASKFRNLLKEVNGSYEITDMRGFVTLIVEHEDDYPFLYELIDVNSDAVAELIPDLPAGVKSIRKAAQVGSKSIEVEITYGRSDET